MNKIKKISCNEKFTLSKMIGYTLFRWSTVDFVVTATTVHVNYFYYQES